MARNWEDESFLEDFLDEEISEEEDEDEVDEDSKTSVCRETSKASRDARLEVSRLRLG